MKREKSTVFSSLRAVSLAIALVSIVAFASIAYSVYEDYRGVFGELRSGSHQIILSSNAATLRINFTFPNRGLYPISIGLTCDSSSVPKVICKSPRVVIQPGSSATIQFMATLSNTSSARPLSSLRGNLSLGLASFSTLDLAVNLGGYVQ